MQDRRGHGKKLRCDPKFQGQRPEREAREPLVKGQPQLSENP